MDIVYKVGSKTFSDKEEAEIYESLPWEKMEIVTKKEVKLVPLSKLKDIFDCGRSVTNLSFYIRDEDGSVEEDGWYETNMLDETGHLNCTDLRCSVSSAKDVENRFAVREKAKRFLEEEE